MTSEELFAEARKLFPEAANVYASVSVQTARGHGGPFTTYSIGVGSDAKGDNGFDIAHASRNNYAECLEVAVQSAEAKKQK